MPVDKERRNKRQNNFIRETYDKYTTVFPKGKKEEYKAYAQSKGMSLSALISKLIEEEIQKDKT